MNEQECFMIEAALNYGFEITDDDATTFACTDKQIIELMKAALRVPRDRAEQILKECGE